MTLARLVFGAGRVHRLPTHAARQRLLARALEAGFRSFDVAPAYGNGLNEVALGAALHSQRASVVIATKFGVPFDAYGEMYPRLFPILRAVRKVTTRGSEYERRDFSAAAMQASLEGSLRRLRSDYVDRLLIHEPLAPLSDAALSELGETAERLRTAGKIREFGIAGPAGSIGSAAGHASIGVVQTRMSDLVTAKSTSTKPTIAYGVYHEFLNRPAVALSFEAFVRDALNRRPNLELVLSSTSGATVDSFARCGDA